MEATERQDEKRPAEQTDRELLDRHAPVLRYDPQNRYRAISAEAAVANECNILVDGDGETIARSGGELSLAMLDEYERRRRPAGERLAFAPGYATDSRRMQADGHPFSGRIYGRVVRLEEGDVWLQYWFFYYYNPKNILGFGKHEGDWEMIQVHLDPSGAPDRATYAQHDFGEARTWDEVESDGVRPIVYVGELSHASYFERGSFPYPIVHSLLPLGIDHALGGAAPHQPDGPEEIPVVEELPAHGWPHWPGRWGSDERILVGRIGDGPPSPANQGRKWSDPEAFHRRQGRRPRNLRRFAGRLLRFVGRASFPTTPVLESALHSGDELLVTYRIEPEGLHRTKYLILTVNEADGRQPVLAHRLLQVTQERDSDVLSLPQGDRPLRVWASAFNGPRQRSELTSIEVSTA